MPTYARADSQDRHVSGLAAAMTVIAMGLGYAISIGDPTTLSANLQVVSSGLQISGSTSTFIASLATLTMAAAVLSAGALGDLYGMRRMYMVGLSGAIAFSALAAAAPIAAVLIIARAGVGVTLAFLIGLSLAITNAVFPPGERAAAIAAYFGVGYAVSTPLPAISGALAHAISWRACFFAVPLIAAVGLLITWRYVPETVRATRRLDVVGMALFAVALLGLVFGISRVETGINVVGVAAIAVGLAAGGGFVMQELRTRDPALDMRVFRSGRFNAAVTAGVMFNIVLGGSMVLLAFYLVTIRKESHELFGILLIPATAMAALAATAAGLAANRFGARTVMVGGLLGHARRPAGAEVLRPEHFSGGRIHHRSAHRGGRCTGHHAAGHHHDGQRTGRPRRRGLGRQERCQRGRILARAGPLRPGRYQPLPDRQRARPLPLRGHPRGDPRGVADGARWPRSASGQPRTSATGDRPGTAQRRRRDPHPECDHGRGADRCDHPGPVADQPADRSSA